MYFSFWTPFCHLSLMLTTNWSIINALKWDVLYFCRTTESRDRAYDHSAYGHHDRPGSSFERQRHYETDYYRDARDRTLSAAGSGSGTSSGSVAPVSSGVGNMVNAVAGSTGTGGSAGASTGGSGGSTSSVVGFYRSHSRSPCRFETPEPRYESRTREPFTLASVVHRDLYREDRGRRGERSYRHSHSRSPHSTHSRNPSPQRLASQATRPPRSHSGSGSRSRSSSSDSVSSTSSSTSGRWVQLFFFFFHPFALQLFEFACSHLMSDWLKRKTQAKQHPLSLLKIHAKSVVRGAISAYLGVSCSVWIYAIAGKSVSLLNRSIVNFALLLCWQILNCWITKIQNTIGCWATQQHPWVRCSHLMHSAFTVIWPPTSFVCCEILLVQNLKCTFCFEYCCMFKNDFFLR